MSHDLLAGLRVIEASAFVAAPLGGMTLAQLGADVIRIDPPGGGLDYKRWPIMEDGTSLFWCGLNKGKRSVAIDIAKPEGRELAMALMCAPGQDSGLVVTNLPPRGFLSYEALSQRRPDLIQVTLQGDRHGGSAVDYTVNPRLGIPYLTGNVPAQSAVNHVLPAWDLAAGNLIAVSLLAAERQRRIKGTGQHVKLSLLDVALAVMGHLGFIAEAQQGTVRQRIGNDLFGAFGRDFVCAGGERVMVVGLTPKQWAALREATGLGHELDEVAAAQGLRFTAEGDRFKGRESIAALIAPWVSSRSLDEVASTFDRHGVCWSRYQTVSELVANDPECSTGNPMFSDIDQPGVGTLRTPGLPMEFSAHPRRAPAPAPRLGEHTEAVLADVLHLSAAAIGSLQDRGIVALGGKP